MGLVAPLASSHPSTHPPTHPPSPPPPIHEAAQHPTPNHHPTQSTHPFPPSCMNGHGPIRIEQNKYLNIQSRALCFPNPPHPPHPPHPSTHSPTHLHRPPATPKQHTRPHPRARVPQRPRRTPNREREREGLSPSHSRRRNLTYSILSQSPAHPTQPWVTH